MSVGDSYLFDCVDYLLGVQLVNEIHLKTKWMETKFRLTRARVHKLYHFRVLMVPIFEEEIFTARNTILHPESLLHFWNNTTLRYYRLPALTTNFSHFVRGTLDLCQPTGRFHRQFWRAPLSAIHCLILITIYWSCVCICVCLDEWFILNCIESTSAIIIVIVSFFLHSFGLSASLSFVGV